MYLLKLFKPKARQYAGLFTLGVLNSVLYSSLIILLNESLRQNATSSSEKRTAFILFALVLIGAFLSRRFYQSRLIRFTNEVLFSLELSIVQKVVQTTYESFTRLDKEKIYTAIGDIKTIVHFPRVVIDVFNTSTMILFSLTYMLFVHPMLAGIVLAMAALLFVVYFVQNKKISAAFETIRELENEYYRYLNDLLSGYKDIKMSSVRNQTIYEEYLQKNRKETEKLETKASIQYTNNEVLGNFAWFAILGFVIFGLPLLGKIDQQATISFTVTILYIIGPLTTLIGTLPYFSRSTTAIRRLQAFESQVQSLNVIEAAPTPPRWTQEFRSLTFRDLEYSYKDDSNKTLFHLGPLNLTIKQGETIFIVGSNGSGKSTFLLLLAGLLEKHWGELYLNGNPVSRQEGSAYRDLITTIFTDTYLFSENYDNFSLQENDPTLQHYVKLLGLTNKIRYTKRGTMSGNLSKGQQKRLAMILALMENKPIIVLDEWAAEQDPQFRYYFYDQLLPLLKKAGKTVIAVTHDDRYFGFADRIIEFNKGCIVRDDQPVACSETI